MSGDSPKPYVWMLSGCFCFSCMGTLAHYAGHHYPWQIVAVGRSAIPLTLVAIWALYAGVHLVIFGSGVLWIRSIAGSVSLVSTFYALSCLPAPEVFTITNMFPIWVALLCWPMLGELPALSTWLSIACGVAGVFVIHSPAFLFRAPRDEDWPILMALLASVSTAFAMLGLNRLRDIDTRAVVVHFSLTALVFAVATFFLLPRKTPEQLPNAQSLAAVLGIGVVATFGQIFLTKAFMHGQPAKISVVGLAQIPITLVLDLIFFDHGITGAKLLGMALVLAPTAWLLWSQKAKHLPLDREPPEP